MLYKLLNKAGSVFSRGVVNVVVASMKYNLKGSGHVGLVLGKVTGKAVAPATGNGPTTIATTNLNSNTSEADVVQQTNPIAENGHELSKERKSIRLLCINSKTWLRIEAGILITIVLVVWILLTLPIIFFYLPVVSQVNNFNTCMNVGIYKF